MRDEQLACADHNRSKEHVMADPTITALMHANLQGVFGQRDPVLRREAIARTYTDDVAFTDDAGTIVGLAAVDDRVQQLLQDAPAAFAFAPDGPIYVGEDTAAMAWRLGPPDSEPVARGIDIASVKDGRISAIRTLLA
jgi:hypothetical protein